MYVNDPKTHCKDFKSLGWGILFMLLILSFVRDIPDGSNLNPRN